MQTPEWESQSSTFGSAIEMIKQFAADNDLQLAGTICLAHRNGRTAYLKNFTVNMEAEPELDTSVWDIPEEQA